MATCAVSGNIKDPSETAISGVTVKASIVNPFFVGTSQIVPKEISTTTDSSGNWTLNMTQSQSFIVTIEYPPNSIDTPRKQKYAITTPASASATFASLATEL